MEADTSPRLLFTSQFSIETNGKKMGNSKKKRRSNGSTRNCIFFFVAVVKPFVTYTQGQSK